MGFEPTNFRTCSPHKTTRPWMAPAIFLSKFVCSCTNDIG